MKCVEVEKQFDSLIDGEISPSIEAEIKEHLKGCFLCSENFESLQEVSGLLRRALPISPPDQLSKRMMKEFARVQSSKHPPSKAENGWKAFFSLFLFPKLATALVAALFIVSIFAAFQVGRTTAPSSQLSSPAEIAVRETSNQAAYNENKAAAPIVEKTVIKTIKIPVVKEKIVTRIVYIQGAEKHDKQNKTRFDATGSDDYALKTFVRKNEFLTHINLTKFRPVADTKARIIKKGESDDN